MTVKCKWFFVIFDYDCQSWHTVIKSCLINAKLKQHCSVWLLGSY